MVAWGTPEYRSWNAMRGRCLRLGNIGWSNYGGRGIRICDAWRDSFETFLRDMGPRPDGTTLDRYPDYNGDYRPGNCRWATRKQQQDRANQRPYRQRSQQFDAFGNPNGFAGVERHRQKWRARLVGKRIGSFRTLANAARYGDAAKFNTPSEFAQGGTL